jgi:hypothetical protein
MSLMQHTSNKNKETDAKGGKRMWRLTLDSWNNLIVAFGVLSGLFVLLTGGATYMAFQLQKREVAAANERFSANEASTERAKADAEIAKEGAAKATERAAKAELTLEEYRAGRSLTGEQKKNLESVLRSAPKGRVIIKPNFLSPEPTRYANALAAIFNMAGFSDVGDKPLSITSTNLPGIFVVIRDRKHVPQQFNAIVEAFTAAKIPFSAHEEPYVPDLDTVVILVGERP